MPKKVAPSLKLHLVSMAFAGAVIWGGLFLLVAVINEAFGFGSAFLEAIEAVYPTYVVGPTGIFLGTLLSMLVGALGAGTFAFAYNYFVESPGRKRRPSRRRPKRKPRPRRKRR